MPTISPHESPRSQVSPRSPYNRRPGQNPFSRRGAPVAAFGRAASIVLYALTCLVFAAPAARAAADPANDTPSATAPLPAAHAWSGTAGDKAVVPPDYKIANGDELEFQVFSENDVNTTQRVSSAGDIRLPMIGTVVVEGLTLRDAETKLEALYKSGGYYVTPQVILSVKQYIERSVSVLGQVNKPDRIVLPVETKNIGIIRAITLAGGLTRIAKTDAIVVTRPGADGHETRMIVNLTNYLDSKTATNVESFQLLPGDIVFIPERNF